MSKFYATDKFIWLEFEHWTLVGCIALGEVCVRLQQSLWQTSRVGADIEPLQRSMADVINALADGPQMVPMSEQGLTMLAMPAQVLVREWREEWCL